MWVEFHVGRTSGLIYQGLRPYFVYVDVVYIHLRLLEIQSDQPRKKMKDLNSRIIQWLMSECGGREGVQEIWTSVIRVSTQNSDMGEGGRPKTGRKFGYY